MRIVTEGTTGARPRVRVTGALREVRACGGRGGSQALRAELGGSEGSVTIVWFGRDHIAGIEPGRVLAVEGMLTERRGRRIIYNPRYELGAGPAGSRPGGLPLVSAHPSAGG